MTSASGQGIWSGLPPQARRRQLEQIIKLSEELYPTFRWFFYDALVRYSAPLTVFGPTRAVLYIGQMYLALSSTEHIQQLTKNFDDLIRAAVVQPPDVPDHLRALLDSVV